MLQFNMLSYLYNNDDLKNEFQNLKQMNKMEFDKLNVEIYNLKITNEITNNINCEYKEKFEKLNNEINNLKKTNELMHDINLYYAEQFEKINNNLKKTNELINDINITNDDKFEKLNDEANNTNIINNNTFKTLNNKIDEFLNINKSIKYKNDNMEKQISKNKYITLPNSIHFNDVCDKTTIKYADIIHYYVSHPTQPSGLIIEIRLSTSLENHNNRNYKHRISFNNKFTGCDENTVIEALEKARNFLKIFDIELLKIDFGNILLTLSKELHELKELSIDYMPKEIHDFIDILKNSKITKINFYATHTNYNDIEILCKFCKCNKISMGTIPITMIDYTLNQSSVISECMKNKLELIWIK